MTTLVSDLVARARIVLHDSAGTRWVDAECIKWVSDGQRELVSYKPEAYVKNQSVLLVAGAKQAVPTDCNQFVEITRNMGADGTTTGAMIRLVDRKSLDTTSPSWYGDTPTATIKNYVFNALDPLRYYVYPPSNGAGYVEIIYAAHPPALTATTDALVVADVYASALLNYLLYRSYSKETEEGSAQLAAIYFGAFQNAVNAKATAEATRNPNVTAAA